jgi:hypothetical protein
MAKEIKSAICNSRDTLLSDAIGAVSLVVILVAGLCLPSLF